MLPFRTRHPPNLSWTPLRRALPPSSLRPLRSYNLEAQLSTSGDFSLLFSPWAKFPDRSRWAQGFHVGPGRRHAGSERGGGGEGKWVCARRRVSGSNSTWLPSARASLAPGCSLPEYYSFFFLMVFHFGVRAGEEGARLAPPIPAAPFFCPGHTAV